MSSLSRFVILFLIQYIPLLLTFSIIIVILGRGIQKVRRLIQMNIIYFIDNVSLVSTIRRYIIAQRTIRLHLTLTTM